jgi:FlgD Ig-like domain
MRLPHLILAAVIGAAALPAFGFAPTGSQLEFPLAWEATSPTYRFVSRDATPFGRSASPAEAWRIQLDRRTGRAHFAIGADLRPASSVQDAMQAEQLARDVVLAHPEMLGVTQAEAALRDVAHVAGKWAVHFDQRIQGIPVYHAGAFVVFAESGRVMAMGSDFFPHEGPVPSALLSGSDAMAAASVSIGGEVRTDLPMETRLFLVPVPSGEQFALAPAWQAKFTTDEPFGEWNMLVDARTGEILSRANEIESINVTGNVDAHVQDFGYCDGISVRSMANLTVNVSGGGNDQTDANGDFLIANGGATPVTLTAQLLGRNFNVNRFSGLGADASYSGPATPGVPAQITWTTPGARQDEIDTYFHAERAHQFMIDLDPGFDAVALPRPMTATIGRTDGFCPGNAWWSPSGKNINFCEAGGSYENTGEMGNVIYHEYGHGVSQELYAFHGANLPSGDMHEGNSDVLANFINRIPVIGYGFSTCAAGIRNSDNDLQWPSDNDGGHWGGQIIAGFFWDSWQSLLGSLPQAQADDAAWQAWHNARALGTPLNQQDEVTWAFIADDDNGDLNDGTPHYAHFQLGAENHNFAYPAVTVGVFIAHDKLPHSTDGSLGYDVTADIVPAGVTLDSGSLEVHYRVNGGAYQTLAMSATGNPDEYSAHIPALSNFSEVDYYIRAADTNSNETTSPDGAPAAFHSFDVCHDYDNGESGPGSWTLGLPGDTAVRGQWELVDPIPTLAQPGDDSTPGAGTMAFITGQCGAPNCTGSCVMPQENACSDVDFGYTTLLSPVYDLTGATAAKVKYDRWFTNNTGASPNFDHWLVEASNDGGGSWTVIEDTTVSEPSWISVEADLVALFGTVGQVQLRYTGQDTGNDSVVECGVDEFRILADLGGGQTAAPALGEALPRVLALSQNQPNPFRPSTRITYALPSARNVALKVYNVGGQVVRVLQSGPRPAGTHDVTWDGRDESGRRVAAGTYFYRLDAGAERLTRKLTILK